MQLAAEDVLANRENPEALERLYRSGPEQFGEILEKALQTAPESLLLRAWRARLASTTASASFRNPSRGAVPLLLFLIAVSGTLAKLPVLFGKYDDAEVHMRNVGFYFLPAIAAYFACRNAAGLRVFLALAVAFAAAALAINAYPLPENSQSVALACLHLPFLLWAFVSYAFANGNWRDLNARVAYLRWNGEAIVYLALIAITGGLTTVLTFALFEAINVDIERWFAGWFLVYAACGAPIVAAHLATVRTAPGAGLAPLLARIFTPIALAILVVYLCAMIWQGRSPYSEREFLIIFNAMLLCVLAMAIFCIYERRQSGPFDLLLCALLAIALVIDVVALSAIIYRLASFGWSPNRTATVVANVLVFVHLAGTLLTFFPAVRARRPAEKTERWIARFVPAYAVWSAIVVFAFPLLFRFR
jgi:hypothetical protein